jgi:hypothetical protein
MKLIAGRYTSNSFKSGMFYDPLLATGLFYFFNLYSNINFFINMQSYPDNLGLNQGGWCVGESIF